MENIQEIFNHLQIDKSANSQLKELYPLVNQNETPLPTKWCASELPAVHLSKNDCCVAVKDRLKSSEVCSVKTNFPIPSACGIYYYEIKILDITKESYMGFGLTSEEGTRNEPIGCYRNSCGYYANGEVYIGWSPGIPYGETFTVGDVIGCGYDVAEEKCFFTKNGKNLGEAFTALPGSRLYPAATFLSLDDSFVTNFGKHSFLYNIQQDMYIAGQQLKESIENFPIYCTADEWKQIEHKCIMKYLLDNNFKQTALCFSKSRIAITVNKKYDKREKIVKSVTKGDIREALIKIKKYYPTLEHTYQQMYFQLMCTEMAHVMKSDTINSNDLNNFIDLGRKLSMICDTQDEKRNLANHDLLQKTISMLAYSDPHRSPAGVLLSPAHLFKLSSELKICMIEIDNEELPLEIMATEMWNTLMRGDRGSKCALLKKYTKIPF